MLSIIIPSRNSEYLQKTIDDLLLKAEGDVEVIVVLDGYWPTIPVKQDKRVIVLHKGTVHNSPGMRDCINTGIAIAKGDYFMKIDEHCMVDQGYDVKLAADCTDDMVVIPRRYRLEPETWTLSTDGRPPIDYMYIAYPYERPFDITCGLHGSEWKQMHFDKKEILIDDTMSWQGSCWFVSRKWWNFIGELETDKYGTFTQEPQEIGLKTQLGGGRLVVNKKTWYAHFHKGAKGKGYGFSNTQWRAHQQGCEIGRTFCTDYWMNNRWEKQVRSFEWLLEKFWPVPTWPADWKERIKIDELTDYSKLNQQ